MGSTCTGPRPRTAHLSSLPSIHWPLASWLPPQHHRPHRRRHRTTPTSRCCAPSSSHLPRTGLSPPLRLPRLTHRRTCSTAPRCLRGRSVAGVASERGMMRSHLLWLAGQASNVGCPPTLTITSNCRLDVQATSRRTPMSDLDSQLSILRRPTAIPRKCSQRRRRLSSAVRCRRHLQAVPLPDRLPMAGAQWQTSIIPSLPFRRPPPLPRTFLITSVQRAAPTSIQTGACAIPPSPTHGTLPPLLAAVLAGSHLPLPQLPPLPRMVRGDSQPLQLPRAE